MDHLAIILYHPNASTNNRRLCQPAEQFPPFRTTNIQHYPISMSNHERNRTPHAPTASYAAKVIPLGTSTLFSGVPGGT